MENASKALLMAAGVLIGILILSLGVYLFINFSQNARQTYNQIQADQINQFNSEFTSMEGRVGLTIYDVISVVRKAREYNEVNEFDDDEDNGIKVTLKGHNAPLDVKDLSLKSSTEQLTDIDNPNYIKDKIEDVFQNLIEEDRKYMTQVDEDQDEFHIKETISAPIYTCTSIEYNDSQRVKSVAFEFDKDTWKNWLNI